MFVAAIVVLPTTVVVGQTIDPTFLAVVTRYVEQYTSSTE
jgi:hypothetical protein